jgi:phosphoenolpyruvate-protein kinase (PTS system EI component)
MGVVLTAEVAIQLLNTVGLGLVGTGLYVVYKALLKRSELLSESVEQLQKAHDAVVKTMDKRSTEIDSRFEDEKKFRSLYLSLLEDAEVHRNKIKEWKQDELHALQGRLDLVTTRLQQIEEDHKALLEKYYELEDSFQTSAARNKFLEKQNKELQVELGKSGPTVRGLA